MVDGEGGRGLGGEDGGREAEVPGHIQGSVEGGVVDEVGEDWGGEEEVVQGAGADVIEAAVIGVGGGGPLGSCRGRSRRRWCRVGRG